MHRSEACHHCEQEFRMGTVSIFRQPDSVGTALSFTAVLFFFFLSMHFSQKWRTRRPSNIYACSVIAKALNRNPEISPTPPLIFTGVKQCEFWPHSQRRSTLRTRRLKTQQDLNSETNSVSRDDGRMSSPSLVKFGPRTPEILSCKGDPLKNFTAIMC